MFLISPSGFQVSQVGFFFVRGPYISPGLCDHRQVVVAEITLACVAFCFFLHMFLGRSPGNFAIIVRLGHKFGRFFSNLLICWNWFNYGVRLAGGVGTYYKVGSTNARFLCHFLFAFK